jgi:hypothetical protein
MRLEPPAVILGFKSRCGDLIGTNVHYLQQDVDNDPSL